jgi:hypothetical protein
MREVKLSDNQIKAIITLIGTLEHPAAWQHIDGNELRTIQQYLAEVIDETDNAWQITRQGAMT